MYASRSRLSKLPSKAFLQGVCRTTPARDSLTQGTSRSDSSGGCVDCYSIQEQLPVATTLTRRTLGRIMGLSRLTLTSCQYDDSLQKAIQLSRTEILNWLTDQLKTAVDQLEYAHQYRHTVTRYRIRLLCFLGNMTAPTIPEGLEYEWKSLTEIKELPMPVTVRKFANQLLKDR